MFQSSKSSGHGRLRPVLHPSISSQTPTPIGQPKLLIKDDDYTVPDLENAMKALHISRARSFRNHSSNPKARLPNKVPSSKSPKTDRGKSTFHQIHDLLKSNKVIQRSNYKPASVEEVDSFASDDETLVSESTIGDRNTDEAIQSQTPSPKRVRTTTKVSRGADGESKVMGAMNIVGSPLLSPDNITLLKMIPLGIYEKVSITKDGVTLTESGVETFVPRCLEDTFKDSVPLRRSTPYSVTFSDTMSSAPKPEYTSSEKASKGPACTENRTSHPVANSDAELPPRAKMEQAYKSQTLSNYTLPDKGFFVKCRLFGCWGQSPLWLLGTITGPTRLLLRELQILTQQYCQLPIFW